MRDILGVIGIIKPFFAARSQAKRLPSFPKACNFLWFVWVAFILTCTIRAEEVAGPRSAGVDTNSVPVPAGWLQLPGRELIFDLHHEGLEFGCRRDAGEMLLSMLNSLLQAGYTVRLSDSFLQDEINYYTINLEREKPADMSRDILECLRGARSSHVLDWDCFKSISKGTGDILAGDRHLPWMSPPVRCRSIGLVGEGNANLPQLHLKLHWLGHGGYGGATQLARRKGGLPGETILLTGKDTLWAFSADMRLQMGERVTFEKNYPQEEWRKSYIGADALPVEKAVRRILQDLDTGLKSKPEPPPPVKGRKAPKPKTSKP